MGKIAPIAALTATLPQLIVQRANMPETVKAAAAVIADDPRNIFERRGQPVRIIAPAEGGTHRAVPLTRNSVIMEVHERTTPVEIREGRKGEPVPIPVTFPAAAAAMYLDMHEWGLRPLKGITTAPILAADGSTRSVEGYDIATGLWAHSLPEINLAAAVSDVAARLALSALRSAFRTFPFADAAMKQEASGQVVVDVRMPPRLDESAFLASLMTAVARPSLILAPGLILRAPNISGAGTGKGILGRAIAYIAFGTRPTAFPPGHDKAEIDKRITGELMGAAPVLFLDNLNAADLRCDTLATAMTESPASVRVMGTSNMVPMNSRAFVLVTGNGLSISEDLVRRFLVCDLDAQREDPESRIFQDRTFLATIASKRNRLLGHVLTIWKWGRQHSAELPSGKPLGSFEQWCSWCRDPLVALGCADPVSKLSDLKKADPRRQMISTFLARWYDRYGTDYVAASELAEEVIGALDLGKNVSRQRITAEVGKLANTRLNGFVLKQRKRAGKWSATHYAVVKQN